MKKLNKKSNRKFFYNDQIAICNQNSTEMQSFIIHSENWKLFIYPSYFTGFGLEYYILPGNYSKGKQRYVSKYFANLGPKKHRRRKKQNIWKRKFQSIQLNGYFKYFKQPRADLEVWKSVTNYEEEHKNYQNVVYSFI